MRRLVLVLILLSLPACVDWPDLPESQSAEATEWPALLPLDAIDTVPDDPARDAANDTLLARADSLRARANVLRRPVGNDAAMERLRQSLDQ